MHCPLSEVRQPTCIRMHQLAAAPNPLHLLVVPCPGLVNVRQNVGGGSFLAGYKRHFADFSSLEVRSCGAVANSHKHGGCSDKLSTVTTPLLISITAQ